MPNAIDTLVAQYASVLVLPVLWGDMDAFQHVNNTASIRWFESSRVRLIEHPAISDILKAQGTAPILASVCCCYRRQLRYPDTVHIGSRVAKFGNTSVNLEHAIVSEEQDCVASEGHSVIVCFDYDMQRPTRISEELRAAIEQTYGPVSG